LMATVPQEANSHKDSAKKVSVGMSKPVRERSDINVITDKIPGKKRLFADFSLEGSSLPQCVTKKKKKVALIPKTTAKNQASQRNRKTKSKPGGGREGNLLERRKKSQRKKKRGLSSEQNMLTIS